MPLPTPEKTWQYDKNKGPYTTLPDLYLAWKNAMIGAALGAWTVVSSCGRVGGVTWTAGAADYWATASAIVPDAAGSSHSWIVLKQTGIASNFQICVDLIDNSGGNPSVAMMYVSASAGFTGGTTTARPTATDEVNANGTGSPQWTNNETLSTTPARLNMFQSTDGQCTRWSIWVNNTQTCLWAVDLPKNPVSGWTDPWIVIGASQWYNDGGLAQQGTYAKMFAAATKTIVALGNTRGLCYLTSESIGGTTTGAVGQQMTFGGDLDSNAYPLCPMGIYCVTTGLRGRLGEVFDLWWGSTTPNDGDHYPADASRLFVQLNDFVHPWGGGSQLLRS